MSAVSGAESFSGTIQPLDQVTLSTRISGWVQKVLVEAGESVKTGQVLLKLRSQDLEARLSRTESNIRSAEINYQNAQKDLNRFEALYKQQAATEKELENMRAAFTQAESGLQSARDAKKEITEALRYAELSAVFDGVVSRKMVQPGDLANPGQPLLEIEK